MLAAIKKAWRRDRKPANILLVLDTSGSMNDEGRLKRAKAGLEVFFRGVEPQDSVGLTIFSDKIKPLIAPAPLSKNRDELRDRVRNLIADGGTAFYDATVEAFDAVRAQKATDRINAVVLLTDGEDTDSQLTVDEVVEHLEGQGDSANHVRVFTIAYSSGASGAREAAQADRRRLGRARLRGQDGEHRVRLPPDLVLLLVMPAPAPYDRGRFNRALIANALLDPFNIVLLAVVLIAGILLGVLAFTLPVAAVLYLAGAARTYFDEDVANKVLERERGGAPQAARGGAGDPQARRTSRRRSGG